MKLFKRLIFLLPALFLGNLAFGQAEWPDNEEDSATCRKKVSLWQEVRDSKESYDKAYGLWKDLIDICPKYHKNLYLYGEDFLDYFIKRAVKKKDTAQVKKYVDSLMWVYDKRMEIFGEADKVKGKKGSHLIKYRKYLDPERLPEGNELLASSVHGLKKNSYPPHIGRYFFSLYFLYKKDSISKEDIAMEYLPISHYVQENINNPKSPKYKKVYKEQVLPKVDKILRVVTDCELLKEAYGRRFEKDSALTPALKQQMVLALKKRGCKDNELFPRIAKSVHKEDPSPASAYEIGVLEMRNENHEEAGTYLEQAIDLLKGDTAKAKKDSGMAQADSAQAEDGKSAGSEVDEERLAEFHIAAGKNANERGLSKKANDHARKALELQSDHPRAYIIIAEAMANSAPRCSNNDMEKGAVHWLAADYAKKARESPKAEKDTNLQKLIDQRLGSYRANFPDQDDMFTHNQLKENGEPIDEPYEIGCWIGESTMPRKSW